MKNKDFFFLQYNKINWSNQEKTKINSFINDYIIRNVISKHSGKILSVFDIGFGIGFFFEMLVTSLGADYQIRLEGCEPAKINYGFFSDNKLGDLEKTADVKVFPEMFQDVETRTTFDFVTAIYVFPHFLSEDLDGVVKKIHSMLKERGKFVLVLANESYLKQKLDSEKDLFIETREITHNGKRYKEVLHYSDIPEIGKVIDYNRETSYYLDLFANTGFTLRSQEDLDDNGFICTLFVFEK